jgi:hypothetical protein
MNPTIWTRAFWQATAERVIATVVGALVAVLTADGFDLLNTNWQGVLTTIGVAAAVSLLKAVLANVATQNGPSLTNSEQVVPAETAEAASDQAAGAAAAPRDL